MRTAKEHYEALLAEIYVWMVGGIDAALALGAQDISALAPGRGLAVDLGAGFGMHSIPLAQAGYDVVAIDTSQALLEVLRANSEGLRIQTVETDLRRFRSVVTVPASLVVCLGDTLTHLASQEDVDRLIDDIGSALAPGGRFVATLRDYTRLPTGGERFIPVRSDDRRIHTCFLEEQPERVIVHDLVHERQGAAWRMRVSSYPKLRLAPDRLAQSLRRVGLQPSITPLQRGMVRVDAALG
jgi:SAM-dependent methyltransferase